MSEVLPVRFEQLVPPDLATIASISIAFAVTETAIVEVTAAGAAITGARPVAKPYLKDYDAIPGNAPLAWGGQFDLTNWGHVLARSDEMPIGSILVAFDTPGLDLLEGRRDLAVIWDLRVRPGFRRQGLGAQLIEAAEEWAQQKGCRQLAVETQDVNWPACRLYGACGFELRGHRENAYRDAPGETRLLWSKPLGPARGV